MQFVVNGAGREIPSEIGGEKLRVFDGKWIPPKKETKVYPSLEAAIKGVGLRDGMTISFHHQLRDGDYVINRVLDACAELGIKNLRLAQTALFPVHEPVIEHIKNGVVNRIEGSLNGPVGNFVSFNPDALSRPVILRSHGRRGAAVRTGELPVDVAFIAASQTDEKGNATGIWGESAFGPIVYSTVDAIYAKKVVIVTDDVQKYPLQAQEITENRVDGVVQIDKIGDPDKIVSGTLKITSDPTRLKMAMDAVDVLDALGVIREGMGFQTGAGGTSLAASKFLGDRLEEKDIVAEFCIGGTTRFTFDIYNRGRVRKVYIGQAFDRASVEFAQNHPGEWIPLDIPHYADPTNRGRAVDKLDVVFLGATEVDVNFNVNVNTHSDGRLLHGIGGHQDTADGAFVTVVLTPIRRKDNPIIRDSVTTLTTPGFAVDIVVTDEGIAINPRRKDLLKRLEGKEKDLPLTTIEHLRDRAYDLTGGPKPLKVDRSKVVALVHWLDGSVLDAVYRVKGEDEN